MKAYCVIAAALAAFATGTLGVAPAAACTDGRCQATTTASAPGKPLQLTKKKSTRGLVKETRRKRVRTHKKPPAEEAEAPATAEYVPVAPQTASAADAHTPLPVVVVRTTHESGDEPDIPVVSAEEFNDVDRAASSPSSSLLTSTIARYLGRPDLADEVNSPPVVNTEDFSAEVKEAFAADPEPRKPAEVALEYILMTFGGALAAASAIRLFAV